ncbi:MAG: tmoE [Ramlibacter sp.]|jgi:toluene monooxygenase system protein E|nr:tmoE [Ramlibacter sp.]
MNNPVQAPQSKGLKTWSALLSTKKRPSEYEIVTHGLHYRNRNPEAPYELDSKLMMNEWYKKHVFGSPLKHADWNKFRDPDQVTYRGYMTMQDGQEEYVDGLLREHAARSHDKDLSAEWVKVLGELYTPLRYLGAAMQMEMAYVVQMAPASTVTNCAAFQEADSTRWMSRVAYRTRELANAHAGAGFGENERKMWEHLPAWQGVREGVEKMLATYDWAENLLVANLIVIRSAEECMRQLAQAARQHHDSLTGMLLEAQLRDGERSRRWTQRLVELALETEGNRAVIGGWIEKWLPLGHKAIESYCAAVPMPDAAREAKKGLTTFHSSLNLT